MNEHQEHAKQSWEKLLHPESLRTNLMSCSMFIAAWELFRSSVIGNLHGFYNIGFDPENSRPSSEYQSGVLDRHRSPLTASLLWFQDRRCISEQDIQVVDRIRAHRNDIAHQLPKFVLNADVSVDAELFTRLIALIIKIDRWWILEVEVPTDSAYDGREIPESEVHSGNMMLLQLMIEVAFSDEAKAGEAYKEFQKAWNQFGPDA